MASEADISLVMVPYGPVERPSLALGLLKAALSEAGLSARVEYLNLRFAEAIGIDRYFFCAIYSDLNILGEWTFARSAFGDFGSDESAYFSLVEETLEDRYGRKDLDRSVRLFLAPRPLGEAMLEIRRRAEAFIDREARRILSGRPRIVGCSSTFQQHCPSLALLRRIRELDDTVVTLMGGSNCESEMGRITRRHFPWVDYVVSGEAEQLLPALCRKILDRGRDLPASELPPGVFGKDLPSAAECAGESSRAIVIDLDKSPIPDLGDYFAQLAGSAVRDFIQPALVIETSRGCWWGQKQHCTFCGLNGHGMQYRSKSPERAIAEFEILEERHGISNIEAVDNILDLKYLDTVCAMLADSPGDRSIFYETKANLNRKQVEKMADAGIAAIQPGIESLHDTILAKLKKGTRATTNVQLLKWAREFGIEVQWSILCGLPDDRDAWYAEMATISPLLYHLPAPSSVNPIQWQRFSPYHRQAAEFGLRLEPARCYSFVYPVSSEDLNDLAYNFEEVGVRNREQNTLNRPGCAQLRRRVEEWNRCKATGPESCALTMTEVADGLEISDTRPCAPRPKTLLSGLEADVYRACETARNRSSLAGQLLRDYGETATPERVGTELDKLLEARLMVAIGEQVLSLATRPVRPRREGPLLGHVKLIESVLARREARMQSWAESPQEIPIEQAFAITNHAN